jgi:hypothetical protein
MILDLMVIFLSFTLCLFTVFALVLSFCLLYFKLFEYCFMSSCLISVIMPEIIVCDLNAVKIPN